MIYFHCIKVLASYILQYHNGNSLNAGVLSDNLEYRKIDAWFSFQFASQGTFKKVVFFFFFFFGGGG